MARSPSVVIVGAPDRERELIRKQISDLVEIIGSESEPERGLELINRHSPMAAVLYIDGQPQRMLDLSAQVAQMNGCAPIVVSRERDPDKILMAMRAGAKDFAYVVEGTSDVRRSILELSLTPQPKHPARAGKIIAVFSCKGGSGATTIATNLAGALLPEGKERAGKAVLLDLDLQMGDVLVSLDLVSRYGWRDLVGNLHRLDRDLLHSSLTQHRCGLSILAQPDMVDDPGDLTPKQVATAISFLTRYYEFVVIDGLSDFGEMSLVALDLADRVLLTMTQDIPALKNAKRCLTVFRQLGYGPEKIKVVLNRYKKGGDLDTVAIEEALGVPSSATVANDFPTVIRAVNQGELLVDAAPRAHVTRDIRELVRLVRGEPAAQRRGFLERLTRRRA